MPGWTDGWAGASWWKLVVDGAQVVGALATVFLGVVALRLSFREASRERESERRRVAEEFWVPAAEALAGLADGARVGSGDATWLPEAMGQSVDRLRSVLQRAVRVLPDNKDLVERMRRLADEAHTLRFQFAEGIREAWSVLAVQAAAYWHEPGRVENPTFQQQRVGQWEDVPVGFVLGYWLTGHGADQLPGIAGLRVNYNPSHQGEAYPFLTTVWHEWDHNGTVVFIRGRLQALQKEAFALQQDCERLSGTGRDRSL